MQKLRILNTRKKKEIFNELKQTYGFDKKLEGDLFLSQNQNLFLLTGGREVIEKGQERQLRIDKAGLYIGTLADDGVKLTVEGSQLIGPDANKSVLEISDEQLEPWVTGEDLEFQGEEGYYIVKHKNDFLGCARAKKNIAQNLVEKNRRIKTLNK